MADFGECVWYLPALSAGRDKFDARWRDGVWLGIRLESGESIVGASEGVAKARGFGGRPENGGRWGKEMFDEFKGAPR